MSRISHEPDASHGHAHAHAHTYCIHLPMPWCGALASARLRRSFCGHVCEHSVSVFEDRTVRLRVRTPFQICLYSYVVALKLSILSSVNADVGPLSPQTFRGRAELNSVRLYRSDRNDNGLRSLRADRRLRADGRGAACSPDCPDCTNREHRPDRVYGRSSRLGAREGS